MGLEPARAPVGEVEFERAGGGTECHFVPRNFGFDEEPGLDRYALPALYELHVGAWENNPNGTFADWNARVSCDRQRAP